MKKALLILQTSSLFPKNTLSIFHLFSAVSKYIRQFYMMALALMVAAFLTVGVNLKAASCSNIFIIHLNNSLHDRDQIDLLIEAIDEEDERSFESLLKAGVDVNGRSSQGWTPLGYAAAEGRLTYVKLLIEKGAQVNLLAYDRHSPLLAAAAEGHLEVVRLLIEKGATLAGKKEDETALFLAAREGHMDIVRFLLPLSPKLTGEQKVDLLINAIDESHKALFDYWISEGADINAIGRGGWTPLGFACEEGRVEFVKDLITKGAKINHPTGDERMPYLAAAGEGKLSVVEVLLEAGVQVDQASANGTTALSMAAREGHGKVLDYLLSKGANVNKANSEGWTALHFATTEGHTGQMKRLIAAGAHVELAISTEWTNISIRSARRMIMGGWTPLMLAIEEENVDAAGMLLEAGANVNVKVDKTVYALEGDWKDQKASSGKLLYAASGWTPLMEAVEKQNLSIVKLLLSKGADKNAKTKQGMSVKDIAQEKGNKEIMDLLK